ncbi:MAG: CPBP family intramembrane metalloprotease [Anaerolineales bacterium]|nr:CPBP family intramembrane metalloprotease [Anaerolineales bacterium]
MEKVLGVANQVKIQPMGWGLSILYFGIPAVAMALGFYVVMPALLRRGMVPYYAYSLALGLPMLLMGAAAVLIFRLESGSFDLTAMLARFRYKPMSGADWLWTGGIFALEMLVYTQFSRVTAWLIERGLIQFPDSIPAFVDPRTVFSTETLDAAAGGLRGNWPVFFFSILLLIINVFGEELLWRGVVLPRQEAAFAAWAWVIHGVLWTLFHGYKYWDLFSLLPLSLGLAFVVARRRNSSIGLVIHFITNGSGLIPILMGVLGL